MPESATMPRSCSQSVHAGPARLAHQHRARVRPLRLGARGRDAVVADHRRREADELLGVARVGDDLLVAGHRRREDGLAERAARRGDRLAFEDRAVLEHEEADRAHALVHQPRPSATVARTLPLQRLAEQPRVDRARAEAAPRSPASSRSASSRTRFAGAPTAMRGALEPVGARRPGRHALEQRLERQQPRLDEVRVERRERGLEPGDAERRLLERHLLLVPRVRRVVGRDARDRAARAAPSISAARSLGAAERRVHLQVRVERAHRLVGEARGGAA